MNPFEMQKKMYEEWEKNLGKYLESTMRQPEFMKLVGRNLETTLDLQGAVKGHLQKALKTLAIPTEAELEGLYRTVNQLETRVLDLEEKLEDMADQKLKAKPAAQPKPKAGTKAKSAPATAKRGSRRSAR